MSDRDDRPPRPDPLPVQPDAIPDELTERDKWVCWQYQWDDGRDKWRKVPINAGSGRNASPTDASTWCTFDEALSYHRRDGKRTDGIGFVVHDEGIVVGLDLDDCRDPDTGDLEAWAVDLLDDVETYAETSPSGTGLRLFGFGFVPDGRNRGDVDGADGHLELYDTARYFTVTGHRVEGSPADVRQVNGAVGDVHSEYVADDVEDKETPKTAENTGGEAGFAGSNPGGNASTSGLSDADVLDRARDAENGDKFHRLWNGNTAGYESHSEADLALCSLLAFWTGGDREQLDRLFRKSALMRPKWDEDRGDRTYGERTIDKALSGRTEFYEPAHGDETPTRPDNPGDDVDARTDERAELSPSLVKAYAGLGEDDDVSDLDDREKAATVWELVHRSDEYHVRVRRDNGSLWAYDDGVWKPEGERSLRHAARQALGAMNYGQNVLGELEAQVRSDPRVEVESDEFGLEPGTVAVENGLVYLDAAADGAGGDALRDLRPDDYALTQLPVEYDPTAEFDEWDDYVDEWAEPGRADALQEYVGYCLHVGGMPIHRALLLVGSGANGKGTFLSVVRSLLGRENTTSIELQTLANERDAVAQFYGSLANIDDDLSGRKLGSGIGMFKKLVAGDRVRGRRLYEDGFEFDATGKHLYAANEVPEVNVPDDDEAFWRRWLLVEFPNHYPPSKRDPGLRDRLTEPESLSAVFNWAVEGRRRLLDQDRFTGEAEYAHEKRQRWQSWGESADEFISECVERDPDAPRLSTQDAHRRYAAWCRENGKDPIGQREFTNKLKNESVGYGRHRIGGKSQRGYKALGLSDEVPPLDDTPEREDDPDGSRQQSLE